MGVPYYFVVPSLVVCLVSAYMFRQDGIPLPFLTKPLDLWGFMIKDQPQAPSSILMENFLIWIIVYTPAHILMYVKPQRSLFHPIKLNPNYPKTSLVFKEIFRSARGVLIVSLYSMWINKMHKNGSLPTGYVLSFWAVSESGDLSPFVLFLASVLIYLWGNTHFYWTHRLLHTKWLYRNVHKVHHESYNPDPFSGLSMHWAESSIYFSAAPLIAWCAPLYMVRSVSIGLMVYPLEQHWGMGSWDNKTYIHHYIHHSKFNWNYGTPWWDNIMGTSYFNDAMGDGGKREKVAREQASMVDCALGNGLEDYSSGKK